MAQLQLEHITSNRSVSAAIGGYRVLGELLKRGSEAYLAHEKTQREWNVIVDESLPKRFEVKSIG
ncbi:hypothetical protein C8R28_10113 [Nitrosomonas ureae]|uniref:Uncharacterized protein n=1 Tax=Nitrosomonas ureae TaxID=44577 RepID=A0A2T5IQJ3_9PROT|nr:hypothetical protein C8R28_10113 [Nitrosomonas ureae]